MARHNISIAFQHYTHDVRINWAAILATHLWRKKQTSQQRYVLCTIMHKTQTALQKCPFWQNVGFLTRNVCVWNKGREEKTEKGLFLRSELFLSVICDLMRFTGLTACKRKHEYLIEICKDILSHDQVQNKNEIWDSTKFDMLLCIRQGGKEWVCDNPLAPSHQFEQVS